MKKIKKAFRLIVFICLMILAVLGIGLAGGVPLPSTKIRRDAEKEEIELVEELEEDQDLAKE